MLFEVQERIALLNCLPAEGNAVTLRIVRDFQGELSFSEEETARIELVHSEQRVNWNTEKAEAKEIEVGVTMQEIIVNALKGLDARNVLHMELLPLYDRFASGNGQDNG